MNEFQQEITDRVVRMDALEDRFGISTESVYAIFKQDDYSSTLEINFDVVSPNGTINESLAIMVSLYNENNQLISTASSFIDDESFIGIESVSQTHFDVQAPPTLIRLFPKKA